MSDLIRKPNLSASSTGSFLRSMKQFFSGFLPRFAAVESTSNNNNHATFFTYALMGLADHKDRLERPQDLSHAAYDAAQESALVGYQARNALAARLATLVKAREAETESQKANSHVTAASLAMAKRHANSHREYEALVKESEARLAFAKRIAGGKAIFNANALNAEQAVSKIAEAYAQPEFSHKELNLSGIVTLQERHDFAQHLAGMPDSKVASEYRAKDAKDTQATQTAKNTANNAAQTKAQELIKGLVKPNALAKANAAQVQAQGFMAGFGIN